MNKKNLAQENSVSDDIQEKNGANEKILENPTSEANDLSNDNTKDRNNEGGVIKEPRINLTTILRGIRSLYIKFQHNSLKRNYKITPAFKENIFFLSSTYLRINVFYYCV